MLLYIMHVLHLFCDLFSVIYCGSQVSNSSQRGKKCSILPPVPVVVILWLWHLYLGLKWFTCLLPGFLTPWPMLILWSSCTLPSRIFLSAKSAGCSLQVDFTSLGLTCYITERPALKGICKLTLDAYRVSWRCVSPTEYVFLLSSTVFTRWQWYILSNWRWSSMLLIVQYHKTGRAVLGCYVAVLNDACKRFLRKLPQILT